MKHSDTIMQYLCACKRWLALLLFCCSSCCVVASVPKNIMFENLGEEEGLFGGHVNAIMQDSQGFIWIAMYIGLQRYDGIELVTYLHKPNDPDSISHGYVYRMLEDEQGYIWMASYSGGLNRFDRTTEKFTRYQHHPDNPHSLSNNNLWALHKDTKGRLWLGSEAGIDLFDPSSGKFINYRHEPDNPNSLSHNTVTHISDAADGGLWLGTHGGGLNHFDPDSGKFTHYRHVADDPNSLNNDHIMVMQPTPDGYIWIGTESGLNRFEPETGRFTRYQHEPDNSNSLANTLVNSLHLDQQGRLWVGGIGGLNLFIPDKGFIRFQADAQNPGSLVHNYLLSISEDRTGAIWAGTLQGVSRYDPGQLSFHHYQANLNDPNSLIDNSVTAFYVDNDGMIWVGTESGLSRFDRENNKFTNYPLAYGGITHILPAEDGRLWVLTDSGELKYFDPDTGHFTSYSFDPDNSSKNHPVHLRKGEIDADGVLWLGTYGHGIYRVDPANSKTDYYPEATRDNSGIPHPNGPFSRWIIGMYSDAQGYIWICTQTGGLSRLNPKTGIFTHYQAEYSQLSYSYGDIHTAYKDSRGIVWVGASNGLNRLSPNNQQFNLYNNDNALLTNLIGNIIEDSAGWLWLGTTIGLIRFDPEHGKMTLYNRRNGFRLERPTWSNTSTRTPDGDLLFAGSNGFVMFDPKSLYDNPNIPPVVFTKFNLFNEPVPIGKDSPLQESINVAKKIVLSDEQSHFSFEFAALNYLYPFENQYAYKLHGYDKDWLYTDSTRRVATYTNLDPGEYRFQVKASNNDGVWNEEGASITVIIKPAWWETAWFRGMMGVPLFLMFAGAVRWRVHAVEARNRILEIRVKRRTAQLRETQAQLVQSEKMASLGVLVAGVAHEVNNPVNFVHVGAQNLEIDLEEFHQFLNQLAGDDASEDILKTFDDKFQEFSTQLKAIQGGSERIRDLVVQLRTFSRLDEAERKPVSLTEGLDSTIQLIQSQFHDDVQIVRDYQAAPIIECFSGQLNQVFMNLMINACQAIQSYQQDSGDKSPGTLTVTTRQDDASVFIQFQDTGCGMSTETQTHAFDPFFTTKPVGKGTGLGLSISHGIIETHKGEIKLEPAKNHGTVVTVRLPLG